MDWDKRTVLTLGSILLLVVAGFAFLIFSPSAKKAMQSNIEHSAQESVKEMKREQ